ncbi:hypothetical protein CIHG_05028 [Coccidioides immitis H538.4]|uniref:Uncharacterized protein n=3 Tax=Coccidioides immitis TaxID=5501 RepID=A0A0J8QPW5_COCIT|nr:hypothetical protein CIRG_03960 [Coccidioides immitis RMSCC 2394]KMU73398.1 hypothetical protein CISG_03533 [Coccidioides immitis RMSCC 3703]KMU87088.1 hypothetical protein CIHG_05028 [Coccidioides immitis H538.4]
MYLVRVHIKDRLLLVVLSARRPSWTHFPGSSERTSYVHIIPFITLEQPSFMKPKILKRKAVSTRATKNAMTRKGLCARDRRFAAADARIVCIAIRICGGSETWYPIRYRPEMSTPYFSSYSDAFSS